MMRVTLAAAAIAAAATPADAQDAPPPPEAAAQSEQPAEPADLPLALTGETAGKYKGFYLRAGVGLVGFVDSDYEGASINNREVEFDPGFGVSAAVGYDLGSAFDPGAARDSFTVNLRGEVEFIYEQVGVDDPGGLARLDDLTAYGGGFNLYLDFDYSGPWALYLGLGLGLAQVETEGAGFEDEDTVSYGQLLFGVMYEASDAAVVYAGIRSRAYGDVDVQSAKLEDVGSAALEAGLMFQF